MVNESTFEVPGYQYFELNFFAFNVVTVGKSIDGELSQNFRQVLIK